MKIALFHNYYQVPGGEDQMFELEIRALRAQGHEVFPFVVRNEDVFPEANTLQRAKLAWESAHNPQSYKAVIEFLRTHEVDIGHVHNWFPLLSPAVYTAHKALGIPVVQTLHNYRLGCANGSFRRNGETCRDCLTGSRNSAVIHRCYKGSLGGSLAWKRLIDKGWAKRIFTEFVDAYIAPSQEVVDAHIEMGLPKEKIHLIPNACEDLLNDKSFSQPQHKDGALFLGRLSAEKGVDTLINAWRWAPAPLKIAGSGPDAEALKKTATPNERIQFLGHIDRKEIKHQLEKSAFLVFPSKWSEPFGLGIIEAMAAGRPVIASNIGAPSQIITHGVNGLLVPPGDVDALQHAIKTMLYDPERLSRMAQAARDTYEQCYGPKAHAQALETLYQTQTSLVEIERQY
ncbi:MAG: glycosyltransferase family 4 protein [Symploca sp. SIO2D2]|nr:glycosyltransferase family 4 protein [Symploca sp. SIO2D2]